MGIFLIMFHNFFHLLPGSLTENEFVFETAHAAAFLTTFRNLSPWSAGDISEGICGFFSFLGHYGVVIFVFLSAYGLTKKYGSDSRLSFKNILYPKAVKFWKLLVPVLVILVVIETAGALWKGERAWVPVALLKDGFLHLLFIHTLYPGKALSIVGAWWFFGVIVQFYLLFPLLNRLRLSLLWSVAVASWLIQGVCIYRYPEMLFYLRTNFIGWLPEFCLGIYLAKSKPVWNRRYIMVAAILLFAGSFFNPYVWLAAGIAAVFLMTGAVNLIRASAGGPFRRFFVLLGQYSFYLFVIHGFVRDYVLHLHLPEHLGAIPASLCFFVLSLGLAAGIGLAVRTIDSRPATKRT